MEEVKQHITFGDDSRRGSVGFVLLVVLLIAAAAAFLWLGKPKTQQPGLQATNEISANPGPLSMDKMQALLPAYFPLFSPLGFSATSTIANGQTSYMIIIHSPKNPQEDYAIYSNYLKNIGWAVQNPVSANTTSSMLSANSGKSRVTITMVQPPVPVLSLPTSTPAATRAAIARGLANLKNRSVVTILITLAP